MARTLIVSNRLPITVTPSPDGLKIERSSGGLATGLGPMHDATGGLWIGWPGFPGTLEGDDAARLASRCEELRVVPIALSAVELDRYYEGYCNGLLWPLFHSFLGQLPLELPDHRLYVETNRRFADAVVANHRDGDLIWVHDYQLLLVPQMIRERLPAARIGFFLHIPFPAPETFRTLPARRELLEGMLAADLVGFHTASYMRNFSAAVMQVLGATPTIDRVQHRGRTSVLGVYPMGIDALGYQQLAADVSIAEQVAEVRSSNPGQLVLGIDRLDYTKGIKRRLLSFERLLEVHPELHGHVRLVQLAVPSRTNVEAYADLRSKVEGHVGRINGRFGTAAWTPIRYLYRGLSPEQVVALYRAAEVMAVTPTRDGMNLVAKEFCAARTDGDGVLVLSEFAGAAAELGDALLVNPYDLDETAAALYRALTMPEEERRSRMALLRQRVFAWDVHRWASAFVAGLETSSAAPEHVAAAFVTKEERAALVERIRAAKSVLLMTDYDGTLVPLQSAPDLARPGALLRRLLRDLAARPGLSVHVVSGRSRASLERWLADLPLHLHAEHGWWSRPPGGEWSGRSAISDGWRPGALAILQDFAARTPGALVEEKLVGLAWHYRACEPEFGLAQANELRAHLAALLSNAPVELITGHRVVELRPHDANKGLLAREQLVAAAPSETLVLAIGDDVTDEEMFAALPAGGVALHVGASPTRARLRLRDVAEVHALLEALL